MKIPAAVPVPGMSRSGPSSPSVPRVHAAGDPRGLIGRVLGDRYGITNLIGEGGMGVVFEAEQLAVGRLVAIKVLHPRLAQDHEAITRLRHEAKIAGTLGHPNICGIYDMGHLDDGSPYLVMERLHGETLAQRIARERALPVVEIVDIALQVLAALVVAHQKGVIHRDLKPDNIFLSRTEGRRAIPKLLDFGISKSEDVEETVADPTGAKLAAGTPFYMAPEQARGDRKIDHRVDLWSMGIILYEGLTGQRPFDANNYNALLVQILSTPARSMRELRSGIPYGIAKVVDRAIAKSPDDRFQTAKDLQTTLHAALAEAMGKTPASGNKASGSMPAVKPASQRNGAAAPRPEPAPASSRGRQETSSDIVNASSTSLPMLIHDHPTEDPDATAVFTRIPVSALRAPQASADPPSEESEDPTPIYGARDTVPNPLPPEFDEERTVVDPPPSFNETLTMVRRDLPVPPKKR